MRTRRSEKQTLSIFIFCSPPIGSSLPCLPLLTNNSNRAAVQFFFFLDFFLPQSERKSKQRNSPGSAAGEDNCPPILGAAAGQIKQQVLHQEMASQTHRSMNPGLAEGKDFSMQSPGVLRGYRGLFVLRGHLPNGFNSNLKQGPTQNAIYSTCYS